MRCFSVFVCVLSVMLLLGGAAYGAVALEDLEGTIAFSSDRSGAWRIWTVSADGEDLEQLTEAEEGAHDVDPVFSKDGKTILFSSTRGAKIGVWTVPVAGGEPTRICDGDQAEWSPCEKMIALRRNGRIWVRDLEGEKEIAISPEGWDACSGPAWHPEGKSLVFAAIFDGKNGMYSLPVEGGEPTKIYDKKGACEPHFVPDGSRIAYETETNICTILPDGTKNRMVTFQAGVQRYAKASPDGKHIVYCQGVSESGPWELYVVETKGGYPVKLTDEGSDMNPDWR